MAPDIPDEVFRFFASSPIGPVLSLSHEVHDTDSTIAVPLQRYLHGFSDESLANTLGDPHFQFHIRPGIDVTLQARMWMAVRELASEIARRRLELIRSEEGSSRPTPYTHPALADVSVDSEGMVPLSDFEFDGSRLVRNGFAFLTLATTGSPNSTYWLTKSVGTEDLFDRTSVRLDPFLWGPAQTFPAMHYLMWMYGRPLDWDRISALTAVEFGQWRPTLSSHEGQFTDYVWSPRDDEVHLICEEVPSTTAAQLEAARYLHAVYEPRTSQIKHLDGALRLYTSTEVEVRHQQHVRQAGKLGLRVKVFRCDRGISRDALSTIAQTFFVWNEDVRRYFGSEEEAPPNPP